MHNMKLYPQNIYEKLEFNKILAWCVESSLSAKAREINLATTPLTDVSEINQKLDEVEEYVKSFQRGNPIPLSHFEGIEEDLVYLQKEGYVLDVEAIFRFYTIIDLGQNIGEYFRSAENQKLAPGILKIFSNGNDIDFSIKKEIDKVLDENGEVKPTASPELMNIFKKITAKEREIQVIYETVIGRLKKSGLLTESNESVRNGRRVVSVPVEHKRRVGGVIHDESSTGKTVFIEPDEAIPVNNAIYSLHTEKKKEIYRIIKQLCDYLRPHAYAMKAMYEVLYTLDVIRSRARVALSLNAGKPIVKPGTRIQMKNAYNPVLFHKYQKEGKEVVPFDLHLMKGNRILVISGPNAGGKSVCMKSVGLLHLMVQSGMLVTCDANSEFGVFNNIFVDIGDQQSIEDDLSTYSSHLKSMKYFSDFADSDTLFLIDEFGSGTDPRIGGAIAEGILKHIHKSGAYGVVTTHYSNLKYFAFKTKGVVNGSMEFDTQRLIPTYALYVGKPGSSFAYEIASMTGLQEKIIAYARHKTGDNERAIDQLLISLQDEQKELQDKLLAAYDKEARLNSLIKNYEHLHKELEFRRKKLKLNEKEQNLHQLAEQNRLIQQTVKEIKKSKDLDKAKQLAEEHKTKRSEVQQSIKKLKEEVHQTVKDESKTLKPGDYARMYNGSYSGQIMMIEKGMAELQLGYMTVKIPVKELIPARAPLEINDRTSVKTHIGIDRVGVRTKADVRGYPLSDVAKTVEELVDNALIHNISSLTIIHGKGNGVLRKAVIEKLREYKEITEIFHPEEEFGGKGTTHVKL